MSPFLRRATIWLCAIVATSAVQFSFAAGTPSAKEVLRAHRLERVGDAWCFPEEASLRQQLNGLERIEQRLVGAQQSVDQIIGENEQCRRQMLQFEQLERQIRAQAAAAKPDAPQRAQFDSQAKAAAAAADQRRRQYIRPRQFGLSPPLKPALADLINVRTEVMLRLLSMRETIDHLTQSYDSLRHESGVVAALASIGHEESLGRLKSLRDDWKIVDQLQPMVFTDSLPVAREGKFYCVTAIVNERQPLTFSFLGTEQQQILIPQNLAEAAGLATDEHAAKVKLHLAKGRDAMARRTKIPRLRFGRHVLRDVDAYILPPEAADIGARVGAQAFAGYHVQLDTAHLLLVINGGK